MWVEAADRVSAGSMDYTSANRITYDRIATKYAENQRRRSSGNEKGFP
jgi:hypothetical protein